MYDLSRFPSRSRTFAAGGFAGIMAIDHSLKGVVSRTVIDDKANFSACRFCRAFLGVLSRFQTTTARWLLGRNANHNKV
jgi:hypothetical protein